MSPVSPTSEAAPKLDRIIETCLHVEDLDRAEAFYRDVLGLTPIAGDQRFRGFEVGGKSVLLLFRRDGTHQMVQLPGGTIPDRTKNTAARIQSKIAGTKKIQCALVEYSTFSPGCRMSSM